MTKARFIRPNDTLDDADTVVVRGGELDVEILSADAARYQAIYGLPGISVFAARGVTVDELAQEAPLIRFAVLTLMRVGTLRAAGFTPRGDRSQPSALHGDPRRPRRRGDLAACEHERWINPYHEE